MNKILKKAVRFHYDKGDNIFFSFLDQKYKLYSCGIFDNKNNTLEKAQKNKLITIFKKLEAKPSDSFLDIGCGWGGILKFAKEFGINRINGITLSRNQYDYIKKQGFTKKVVCDNFLKYSFDTTFDKITSIGMFEHLPKKTHLKFFKKIHQILSKEGLFLLQTAVINENIKSSSGSQFIKKYIFPDAHGKLYTLSSIISDIEKSGLVVKSCINYRESYLKTLQAWYKNLEMKKDAFIAENGLDNYHIFRMFLAGTSFSYDKGNILSLVQILIEKK